MPTININKLDVIQTLKSDTSTVIDTINDEIKPEIDNCKNIINNNIKPDIDENKGKISTVSNIVNNEIRPITNDIVEVYEPIIINILLSNIFMFLNRIFKWYTYTINEVSIKNASNINFIIVISLCENKNIYKERHKLFKNKLNNLKKDHNINYATLVKDTIMYIKNDMRVKV